MQRWSEFPALWYGGSCGDRKLFGLMFTSSPNNHVKMATRVNYDQIAATYDSRFAFGLYDGVLKTLRALVIEKRPKAVLEVGCGTGYWLAALRPEAPRIFGLDYSSEMLRTAHDRQRMDKLVRATAESLPFRRSTFHLIFCVNAIHHFDQIDEFITEARRLLRPGGILAVIGMDPHHALVRL